MIIYVVLTLIASSVAQENLRQILKSPKSTLKLYSDFKAGQGLKYRGQEDAMRFRLFRKNAEFVADLNDHEKTATFALNFFSSMTNQEKKQYQGLNITELFDELFMNDDPMLYHEHEPSVSDIPEEKLWTNEGAVTAEVRDQGDCGSCWAFSAVGALETRYKIGSGVLRRFSEQEFLDCTYEDKKEKDGCEGGSQASAYSYSGRNGRLAAEADYKYTAKVGPCKARSKPNGLIAMKLTYKGYHWLEYDEAANIKALSTGALVVSIKTSRYFYQYSSGIAKDTTCKGFPDHGVTAVGYTAKYVLAKNSWGTRWGEQGFIKFARNHDNCGLFQFTVSPNLVETGKTDTGPSDPATTYRPGPNDDIVPVPGPCDDKLSTCRSSWCSNKVIQKYCQKTCNLCDGKCVPGTVRCDDGLCRHEHMC